MPGLDAPERPVESCPGMPTSRLIRIFGSSPGDLTHEQEQLGTVVQELNATVRALVPDKGLGLELIRWQTHTHPDLGSEPQSVVDDQLGYDYDVYVGMMWSRFGTPTSKAGSGTEQEFRAAYAGWEERRRPSHVLFYFCEEAIPASVAWQGADQLKAINTFRTELERKGLVGSYGSHGQFGDKVRRDLVLVLSRLLHADEPPARVAERATEGATESDLASIRGRVAAAAQEYERIRDQMSSGALRTRRMEVVASQMRTLAQGSFALLPELSVSDSPGRRLAAVTVLQVIPDPRYLSWLVDRIESEKPFIGYHAAVALLAAARELPPGDLPAVGEALARAEATTRRLRPDTDRSATLQFAREELDRRAGDGGRART
jgi:hypothetical protein